MQKIKKAVNEKFFKMVHGNRLIYNTCWEDPTIDRRLLDIQQDSKIVMITSAGCNALDYLLDQPFRIHAVDVNPRQNALLALKIALIHRGNFDDFFLMFGKGRHAEYKEIYKEIRGMLPEFARDFWDRKITYFRPQKGLRNSFYFHGTSGLVAWFFKNYLFFIKKKAAPVIHALLAAQNIREQEIIYAKVEDALWDRFNSWLVRQPALMSLMGVPSAQIVLIEDEYPGGLTQYIKDKIKHVFTTIPIHTNYFWRVYLTGEYSAACCPNYLKYENFELLRCNVSKIKLYSSTLTDFLKNRSGCYTHFILLDHQDWMAGHAPDELEEEWELILKNSRPGASILFRSAGTDHAFLPQKAKKALEFMPRQSEPLHQSDRVGTYGSLHFAKVAAY